MVSRKKSPSRRWAQRLDRQRSKKVHCRLPDHVHSALEQAAARNGWTISAEVVHRLEETFAAPATPTQAFFSVVAHAVDGLTPPKSLFRNPEDARAKASWLNNPYFFREASRAVECALGLVAPAGGLPVGEDPALAEGPLATPDGRLNFQLWWNDVRLHNVKAPVDNSRPDRARHQHRLTMLRTGLGSLPDKVELWGLTGKQARRRRRQSTLSVAEFKQFRRLTRTRIETGLSEQQHKRFRELFNQAPLELKQQLKLGDPFKEGSDPHDLSHPGPFGKIIEPLPNDPVEDKFDEDNDPGVEIPS